MKEINIWEKTFAERNLWLYDRTAEWLYISNPFTHIF